MRYEAECGCVVRRKLDAKRCMQCAGVFCGKHLFIRVDESNAAITQNAPRLCERCYKAKYESKRSVRAVPPLNGGEESINTHLGIIVTPTTKGENK